MEKQSRLTSDIRENLVAYLDGELEDALSQRIDQLLGGNAVARHEVETLSRTWELLDMLPHPKASEEFGSKTMSIIRLDVAPKVLVKPEWIDRAKRIGVLVAWGAGTVACAVLGFTITNSLLPNPPERMLRELPLIRNLDLYSELGSDEYLKELQASGLFDGKLDTPTH